MDQRGCVSSGRRRRYRGRRGSLLAGRRRHHRVLLIGSVLLVMIVEILNSAIEAVVDRIGSDFHELSGRAKDMGSAAVLLAIIIALITWGTLLWSHYH